MSLEHYHRYLCWKNDPENLFQEEILKEKAAVLARAGDRLAEALAQLRSLDERMRARQREPRSPAVGDAPGCPSACGDRDEDAVRYNRIREQARQRYYELIVIREALGLRRHHWIEAVYAIPPRKEGAAG
jgi:hypothetical protein